MKNVTIYVVSTLIPANIYLFKVDNRYNRKRCEICSKLTKKHQNDVNDVVLVFLSLTCYFEQGNVSWDDASGILRRDIARTL